MVFDKIKESFGGGTDEKYEVLYYKYSKLKLENQALRETKESDMKKFKENIHEALVYRLIEIYEDVETAKMDSFKIKAVDKEMQKLLISLNNIESNMQKVLKEFHIEEVSAEHRMYDPEMHDIASYEDAKGMQKGVILKTAKKGFKYKGQLIKKPRVVVMR